MNFLSYFKGPSSQDQQKFFRRSLITSKVTLTGQSHLMLIFVLRKVTTKSYQLRVMYERSYANSLL
jgi:hypothetical protein